MSPQVVGITKPLNDNAELIRPSVPRYTVSHDVSSPCPESHTTSILCVLYAESRHVSMYPRYIVSPITDDSLRHFVLRLLSPRFYRCGRASTYTHTHTHAPIEFSSVGPYCSAWLNSFRFTLTLNSQRLFQVCQSTMKRHSLPVIRVW